MQQALFLENPLNHKLIRSNNLQKREKINF